MPRRWRWQQRWFDLPDGGEGSKPGFGAVLRRLLREHMRLHRRRLRLLHGQHLRATPLDLVLHGLDLAPLLRSLPLGELGELAGLGARSRKHLYAGEHRRSAHGAGIVECDRVAGLRTCGWSLSSTRSAVPSEWIGSTTAAPVAIATPPRALDEKHAVRGMDGGRAGIGNAPTRRARPEEATCHAA